MASEKLRFPSFQLIDSSGDFDVTGLEKFTKETNLSQYGCSYKVVAIIGPQSSGKSTLLNHLLGTDFNEMDATQGRFPTTNGVWLAFSNAIKPCTLVMDTEGIDGIERGEEGVIFGTQTSLLALTAADTVLVNMWNHDVGRQNTSTYLLLKTMFQAVMKLENNPRNISLIYVIRDKDETPIENLKSLLETQTEKIWNSIQVRAWEITPLNKFFNVQVVALSHYLHKKADFKEEVCKLKRQIITDSNANLRESHATAFTQSLKDTWEDIKNNDIGSPSCTVMLPGAKCYTVSKEKPASFFANEEDNSASMNHNQSKIFYEEHENTLSREEGFGTSSHGCKVNPKKTYALNEFRFPSIQLIDSFGVFNVSSLEKFSMELNLPQYGDSYEVIAIMGPQSSGKSTLLNHLFGTDFTEMDAKKGRSQTTNGIWIALSNAIKPCTLVMDIEGTDGIERGEDDTVFEKQSALFAFKVADPVLINVWCHDVGRLHASDYFVLKTVFLAVRKLKKSHRKITLTYVIRDNDDETPLDKLEPLLKHQTQKIWDSLSLSYSDETTPLNDFFHIEVVTLPNYKNVRFKEEVNKLKEKLIRNSNISNKVNHVAAFTQSLNDIWEDIKNNKDLDIPTYTVMLAGAKCDAISKEKLTSFVANEKWLEIKEKVKSERVDGFGQKMTSLVTSCLSGYDEEAIYFDENVRFQRREELKESLYRHAKEAYIALMGHNKSIILDSFKKELDNALGKDRGFATAVRECTKNAKHQFEQASADATISEANWSSSYQWDEFEVDIHTHVDFLEHRKLVELINIYKQNMNEALRGPTKTLLLEGSDDVWRSIRQSIREKGDIVIARYFDKLSGFEMDSLKVDINVKMLESYAIEVVKQVAREESKDAYNNMTARFLKILGMIDKSTEDAVEIIRTAHIDCLKLLSTLAVIRLEDRCSDSITETLYCCLLDENSMTKEMKRIKQRHNWTQELVSNCWKEVIAENMLLTPLQCREVWKIFLDETKDLVSKEMIVKVLRETAKCDEICTQKLSSFLHNEKWCDLREKVKKPPVDGFRQTLKSLIHSYLTKYDEDTASFEENVRSLKRKQLEEKLYQHAKEAYTEFIRHARSKILDDFEKELDNCLNRGAEFSAAADECKMNAKEKFAKASADANIQEANWNSFVRWDEIEVDIDRYVAQLQDCKLQEVLNAYKKKMNEALRVPLKTCLLECTDDTWKLIRQIIGSGGVIREYRDILTGFKIDDNKLYSNVRKLENHAIEVVKDVAKEESKCADKHILARFFTKVGMVDNPSEDAVEIIKRVRIDCLKLLSVLAVIRLDETPYDPVEEKLFRFLGGSNSNEGLGSRRWNGVDPANTLLTPLQCKQIWNEFIYQTDFVVNEAIAHKEELFYRNIFKLIAKIGFKILLAALGL